MAFSFSVPRFTYAELRAENDALTDQERQVATQDLYGIDQSPIVETPELIEDSLVRLDGEIERIPNKEAYEMAQVACPDYVNSTAFRLLFLRAELFNAKLAAIRLAKYWDTKVDLFGVDRAFHKLTLDDFDEEDQVALTKGGFKVLPEKDAHDRAILVSERGLWDNRPTHRQSMLRVVFYMLHVAVEDEQTQRNGLVVIMANRLPSHSLVASDTKLNRRIFRNARTSFPIRAAGIHQIVTNTMVKLMMEISLSVMTRVWRARFRQHKDGVDLEAFGIPLGILPPDFGGTFDFDYDEWLGNRRQLGL